MNRINKTLIILLLNSLSLEAQKLSDVKWSDWIAISDRNENRVLFSFAYAKFGPPNEVDEKRTGLKWYFRIKNDYKENISGRFIYEYSSTDGAEHTNSYIIHCMQGKSIVSNELLFVTNAEKLLNIYFVEFNPCSHTSKLSAYTKKDTAIFRLQEAMIAQQKLRIQSANTISNASSNSNNLKSNSSLKTVDFSDKTIIYKGKNEEIIHSLLSKVKGWRTNSGLTIQDGIPPEVPIDNNCQRDQYVYSAILYSWAAESYYRINGLKKAEVASVKISELINLVNQLCGGGPAYVARNCKTAFICPCNGSNNNQSTSAAATIQQNNNNIQNLNSASSSDITLKEDMKKEKELLYSLLPLASIGFNRDNANFTNAFSEFANKFDKYVDEDETLGTGVKLFVKLANYNTMAQLRELSGYNTNYNNLIQGGASSPTASLNQSTNNSFLSTNKPMSEMSSAEIRQQIEPLWNAIGSLIEAGNDEDGLSGRAKSKITERYEAMRDENKKLKNTYGYDLEDLKYAIKNFDDELLDKILDSNFPIDFKLYNSPRTESGEQAVNFTYENWGNKYTAKPIHYAAKYGNVYAIKRIIAKGGNIDEQAMFHNMYGLYHAGGYPLESGNPLVIAIYFNRYEAAKYLLEIMKNPIPKKFWKETFLDAARAWKNDEMLDLIKSYVK
ncbi:MAG: ankyrin repeat domain-containing protein [Chitinophagaceae bacterium]|nr:ankyrin repeat domain-containing protein [Chitinophagaceae bacterium]